MPFSYKPSSEIIRDSLSELSNKLDKQNELLEKLIKAVSVQKTKK